MLFKPKRRIHFVFLRRGDFWRWNEEKLLIIYICRELALEQSKYYPNKSYVIEGSRSAEYKVKNERFFALKKSLMQVVNGKPKSNVTLPFPMLYSFFYAQQTDDQTMKNLHFS